MIFGDLYWVSLPDRGGREQRGRRPAIIWQDRQAFSRLPTVLTMPLQRTALTIANRFGARIKEQGGTMETFAFQIVLADVGEMTEEMSNDLYEAGCRDGTPFSSEGVAAVGFARQARSLDEAIRSAIADVQKAGYRVACVESPDQPVLSRINRELTQR